MNIDYFLKLRVDNAKHQPINFEPQNTQILAEAYKAQLEKDGVWDNPIVTQIVPLENFFPAEDYHNNYFENNPQNGYCQAVVRPKVERFRKVFGKG